MSDNQAGLDGCGCFGWLKFPKKPHKHGSTLSVAEPAAPNSDTLLISNSNASSPWEDWKIDGGDDLLKKWEAWNRKCLEENQPDSEVQNILEKIWITLQGMLNKAKERGQRVLQSELLKAALDLIPDNAGFPAGALIKVLVQLILLGLKLAGAKKQIYDFTIEVVSDMNRIAGAFGKGTADERALHQCWEDLEETRKTVNQICAWANKALDENLRLDVSTAIAEFGKKLDHARTLFLQLATIRQLRYLADHGQKIDEVLGHQVSLQRIERIKTTLGSRVVSKAIYANWDTKEQQYKRPCHPETRDTVLIDIDGWIHKPDTTSCLWITGMAGVGKSAIALTTADCLKDRRAISAKSDSETIRSKVPGVTLVGEYFVSFRDAATNSIESLFPTIAMQLANASMVAQVVIDDALKQTPTVAYHFGLNQAQLLFVEPLRAVAEHNPNNLVIIIDGVDEFVGDFTHANQEALHRTVTSTLCDIMSQLPPNVKVLILSRRERGIAEVLDESPNNIRQLPLPIDESRDDVMKFLRPSLKEYAVFSHHRWEDWPDEQQFDVLYYLADGHFTCASVAFRWIVSELDSAEDPEIRRNEVFDDLRSAELTGLDELYGFVLAREILDKSGKPIQFRLDVIGCLVLLKEPIPNIGVLSALIDAKPHLVLDVIQRTRSLLFEKTEPITEQTVLKPHKSFVDFITSGRDKRFPIDVARNHHQLAKGCFRILLDPEKLHFNMAGIESLDQESTDSDVKPIIAEDVTYVCIAFLHHLVNASKSDALFPQLSNFLENQFLFWLEVLVLVAGTHPYQTFEAATRYKLLLDKMGNVLQTHHQHAQLAHIVDDTRKFIDHFGLGHNTDSTGIPSIYFSAIPFAPASSLIANHYRARFPPALHSIVLHPNNNWDEIPRREPCHSAVTDGKRILILNIETDIHNLTQNFTVQCFDAQSGDALSSISMTSDENEETDENPMVRISWAFSPDENTMVRISLAFSPDAKFPSVSYVSYGHAWRLWAIRTGEGETDENTMVRISWAVSPDAKSLAVSYHRTCRVWNIETGEQEKGVIMKVPADDSIESICLPDSSHVIVGCESGDIRVWSRTLGEIPTSPFHPGPVRFIAHSPRGTHIVSVSAASEDEGARVWDISTGVCTFTVPGRWYTAAFSPNGSQIATASDATIQVWNVLDPSSESSCPPTFEVPSLAGTARSLAYSPDGRFLVSGHDWYILIWDISTSQRIGTLIGQLPVDHLAFFPDGKRFISLSSHHSDVRIWDIESLLNGQRSEADSLQWDTHRWILNADGKRLFRPPGSGMFNDTLPFRHPRNTLAIGSCFPTPSFLPVAYDEEWTKLGESLMYHARKNLQPVSA